MIYAGGRVTFVLKWLATLLLLLTLGSCGSKLELYRDLPAHEANEMLALLMSHGIYAEKTTDNSGNASLSVDIKDVPTAMELLNGAGLPQDIYADMGSLFKKEGMISSPTEERVRYVYGITQELSRTLSIFDNVLNARVHVVLSPEETSDDRHPSLPSSAAVLIRYAPGTTVDQMIPKIKELVANSLEGLSYERVSVVLVEASQAKPLLTSVDRTAVVTTEDGAAHLVIGLVCGIAVLLFGSGVLGFLLWRRGRQTVAIAAQ